MSIIHIARRASVDEIAREMDRRGDVIESLEATIAALRKRVEELEGALEPLVEEFGCSIELYDKNGPDWTHKDGTEVFEVSTLLDRRELIDRARALLRAKGGEHGVS